MQAFLAGQLARRGMIRRQTVAQMWPGDAGEDVPLKTVDVHVCRLRKRLNAIGVTLTTVKGVGWTVDAADRGRLMTAMSGEVGARPSPPPIRFVREGRS